MDAFEVKKRQNNLDEGKLALSGKRFWFPMGLKTLGGEDKIFDGLDDEFADISFFS